MSDFKEKNIRASLVPDTLMEDCLELLSYYHPELYTESLLIIPNETLVYGFIFLFCVVLIRHVVEYTVEKYMKSNIK